MTSEPNLSAVLGAYQRDLGDRLDELASLRRQASGLAPGAAREIDDLLDVVTSSVRRSAEASEVLAQWLAAQQADATSAPPRASRLRE